LLFLKPKKCEFEKRKVEYLRLTLNREMIEPDPSKVKGLKMWPITLKNVREVRSTLEVLNFNHAFIPRFTHIAKPLTELLKKGTPFIWNQRRTEAVKQLVDIVTTHLVLIYPDPTKPFELEVDASDYAMGAILFQQNEKGKAHPIGYHSQTFSETEQCYDIYDEEFTAIN
jgi:hypothetical protein